MDYTYNFNDATNFARPNNARPTDIAKRKAAKAKPTKSLVALTLTKSRTRGPTISNLKEVAKEISRDIDEDDLVSGAS